MTAIPYPSTSASPILQQHPQERSTFLRPVASCQHRQFAVHRFRHIHAKGVIFSLAYARLFGQLLALILSPVAPDLYGGRAIAISSPTLATNERKLNHGLSLAVEVSADSDGIAQLPTHWEFRLSRSKSALAVQLANFYQERQRSLATSYSNRARRLSPILEVSLNVAPAVPERNPCPNPTVMTSVKK